MLTLKQKTDFLIALKEGHSVTKACVLASVARRTAYHTRAEDPEFQDAWDDALKTSLETLEDELRSRALDRDDPKSHILLIFLLKKLNPEYKENYKVPEKVHGKTKEFEFSVDEMKDAIHLLEAAKKRAVSKSED